MHATLGGKFVVPLKRCRMHHFHLDLACWCSRHPNRHCRGPCKEHSWFAAFVTDTCLAKHVSLLRTASLACSSFMTSQGSSKSRHEKVEACHDFRSQPACTACTFERGAPGGAQHWLASKL